VDYINGKLNTAIDPSDDSLFEEVKPGVLLWCETFTITIMRITNNIIVIIIEIVIHHHHYHDPAHSFMTFSHSSDLCNAIEPESIPDISRKPRNQWEMNENHDRMLNVSRTLGLNTINIGGADLSAGTVRKRLREW